MHDDKAYFCDTFFPLSNIICYIKIQLYLHPFKASVRRGSQPMPTQPPTVEPWYAN